MSPCFNAQKGLYSSHTACLSLFSQLCLKPAPYNVWERYPIEARVLHSDVTMLRNKTKDSNGGVSRGECVGEKLPLEETLRF